MTPLSKLSIAAFGRPGEKREDGSFKTERNSWDFVVDGISLRSTWQDSENFGPVVAESVGVLGWGESGFEAKTVAKLQGDGQDYLPNRVAIYVCPECGDLGCGAVTVAIDRDGEVIIWSDFRWEVNWYADHPDESTVRFELGPFRFACDEYTEVLNDALRFRPEAG